MARIAIYARVSTNSQSTEQQLFTLREVATRTQSTIIAEYSDTISGSTESRPGLDALLLAARQRKFDVLYCYSIDRLGRSTKNLIAIVEELQTLKIDLFFYREGIDTTTATGRCVFTILSSVAELERNLIRERVTAGLAKAKRNGKKLGRPSKMNDSMATAITQWNARATKPCRVRCAGRPAISRSMRSTSSELLLWCCENSM